MYSSMAASWVNSMRKTPRFGMFFTSPSCSRRRTASQIGVRLFGRSRASCSTLSRLPGENRRSEIIFLIWK